MLPRRFYRPEGRTVAPELLNKLLVRSDGRTRLVGRIIEVEAYGGADDPGSHAFRGPTTRNATMFGPPGHLYVYFTYGMHFCANAVCGEEGEATAVLLRALEPLEGVDEMRLLRPAARRPERDLCSGPAKLCQAFGLDRRFDGADLVSADRGVSIVDDGTAPPSAPAVTARIGLTAGADRLWRYCVPGHPGLSRRERPVSSEGPVSSVSQCSRAWKRIAGTEPA